MDLMQIKEGLTAAGVALTTLKSLTDLIPSGQKRKDAIAALEMAERQLKLAEVQTLSGLGYQLCRNHKFPEVMISKDNKHWTCTECGNTRNTTVVATVSVRNPR